MNFKNPTSRSTLSNNFNNYPKAMPLIHEKITVYTFRAYITAARDVEFTYSDLLNNQQPYFCVTCTFLQNQINLVRTLLNVLAHMNGDQFLRVILLSRLHFSWCNCMKKRFCGMLQEAILRR